MPATLTIRSPIQTCDQIPRLGGAKKPLADFDTVLDTFPAWGATTLIASTASKRHRRQREQLAFFIRKVKPLFAFDECQTHNRR
jgi:hypothetical protein